MPMTSVQRGPGRWDPYMVGAVLKIYINLGLLRKAKSAADELHSSLVYLVYKLKKALVL